MSKKIASEKPIYSGCGYLALTLIGVMGGIHLFAETAYPFNTIVLYVLSFVVTSFAFMGFSLLSTILALLKSLFRFSLKPIKDSKVEEPEWEKSRIWVVFPINVALFWADSRFLLSCSDTDVYIYTSVGFLYALVIYIMTRNGYYSPMELTDVIA